MHDLTNKEINAALKDATEEASKIDSSTSWHPIGHNWWVIRDEEQNHLGWVDVSIDCCSAICTFKYRPESTYTGIERIEPITVDARNLTDSEELQKLIDFDSAIVNAYQL